MGREEWVSDIGIDRPVRLSLLCFEFWELHHNVICISQFNSHLILLPMLMFLYIVYL